MVKPLLQSMWRSLFTQMIVKFLFITSFIVMLSGCQSDIFLDVEIANQAFEFETFKTSDVLAKFNYENSVELKSLNDSYFDLASLEKLSRPGHHRIKFVYESIETEFMIVLLDDELSMQQSNIFTLGLESGEIIDDYETWLDSIKGASGQGISDMYINETGELIVVYSDETFVNLGNVVGKDAESISFEIIENELFVNIGNGANSLFDLNLLKGADGVSILNLAFNEDEELIVYFSDDTKTSLGSFSSFFETLAIDNVYTNAQSELIIVLTDGRSFNVGSVLGPTGPVGERGLQGIQGPQGVKGDPGSKGESPLFRLDGVMMQYKYPSENDTLWRDLFNFQTLESETYTFVTKPGIVLRVNSDNALQWKPDESPDSEYQTLYTADDLRGETGLQGEALEIRYNQSLEQIETKYASDTTWTLLAEKDVFIGPAGDSITLTVSSNAIYWAVDDGDLNYQKLTDLSVLQAPPANIVVSGGAIYNITESSETFVISLSALQGPIGPSGRSISQVSITNNEWIVTYDDGHLQNLGALTSEHTVSFRLNGFIYDIQTVLSGGSALTPKSIPVPYGTTVSGFSSALSPITKTMVIDTVLDYDIFTAVIDQAESITLTALKGVLLPTPPSIEGYDFVKYYTLINNQKVQIYDGFDLEVLFRDSNVQTLFREYERTLRFNNQTEEARIEMIDYVLNGLISITNFASDGTYFGSGVIIEKTDNLDGTFNYIGFTNYHVIENYNQVDVSIFIGGNEYIKEDVTVLGSDPKNDVAVLSFSSNIDLNAIEFANSMTIQTSQTVYSLGNPLGLTYFNSVTEGILISNKRFFSDDLYESYYIQHSSAINPGNSGGPLIDSNGKILGLNTLKILSTGQITVEAFSFAIPSLIVERVVLDVLNGTSLERGSLGITIETLPTICDSTQLIGICIDTVAQNSPAEKMGLQSGDIITYYKPSRLEDFFKVNNIDELREAIFLTRLNEAVTIQYIRNGVILTTSSETLE